MQDHKDIHELRSFDVVSVFTHLSLIIGLFSLVTWGHFVQGKMQQAKYRAQALGLQVSAFKALSEPSSEAGSRMPASAELGSTKELGLDPWGQKYKVMKTSESKLVVWSLGPNGIDESLSKLNPNQEKVEFGGDDVGSTVDI